MSSSKFASQLAGMRKRVEKVCPVCGATFTAIKKAVYCSNKCKQRAKRERAKPPLEDPAVRDKWQMPRPHKGWWNKG